MSTDAVLRELLVRHLESWLPGLGRRTRRATVALAYAGDDAGTADAALGAVAGYADRLGGRQLTVLVLADGGPELATRLGAVEASLPGAVTVHLVPGGPQRLAVAVKAAGGAGSPLLSYVDGPVDPAVLRGAALGRPAEVLVVRTDPVEPARPALTDAGFALVAEVDLVPGDGPLRRLAFGTGFDRSLEAFKETLWAAGQDAGVRYRDPADPDGRLLDAADPEPGPLCRELLVELTRGGPRTVTELRRYATTSTVYRSVDAVRAVTGLLDAGAVTREPEHGRLGGDVLIAAAPAASAG